MGNHSTDLKFDKVPNTEGITFKSFDQTRLFINGVHPDDVDQGLLGDCFFLSSIASIALQNSKFIQDIVSANEDGTFSVKLFKSRSFGPPVPKTIVIDNRFPVKKDGRPAFAGIGDQEKTTEGIFSEIWPMVLEKAYAQMKGSYNAVIGGWPHTAMESLTGLQSEKIPPREVTFEELADLFDRKYAMAMYTRNDLRFNLFGKMIDLPDYSGHPRFIKNGGDLTAMHAYFVSGISREDRVIKLRNPWGWEHGESLMTQEEIRNTMRGISVNRIVAG